MYHTPHMRYASVWTSTPLCHTHTFTYRPILTLLPFPATSLATYLPVPSRASCHLLPCHAHPYLPGRTTVVRENLPTLPHAIPFLTCHVPPTCACPHLTHIYSYHSPVTHCSHVGFLSRTGKGQGGRRTPYHLPPRAALLPVHPSGICPPCTHARRPILLLLLPTMLEGPPVCMSVSIIAMPPQTSLLL